MVRIFVNTEEVIASLATLRGRYQDAAVKGFAEAGRLVVELFRNDWLSGRQPGDIALNVQTGKLRDSIRSVTTHRGPSVTSEVFNRGAQYWEYHQTGTDSLPKRLYLLEAFEEDGAKIYAGQVEIAMGMLS